MRVIGGQYRSRLLSAPRGLETRPTSDRLRETLFNVLAQRVAGAVFLDLYAGSGAVGIEALSRGAAEAIFVEQAEAARKAIRANLSSLGIRSGYMIDSLSVAAALKRLAEQGRKVDIVFLDPPYAAEAEYESALGLLGGKAGSLLAAGAVVAAEHEKRRELAESYGAGGSRASGGGRLVRYRVLRQGDAAISFYSVGE